MKKIAVLGSTGSIGRQTLDVCGRLGYRIPALAGGRNEELLEEQARRFRPELVCMADETAAAGLRVRLADTDCRVRGGTEAVLEAARADCDIVLNAVTGLAGLRPSLAALDAGRTLALANKETLVAGGQNVMRRARESGVRILPVDSEHSAIFQCLQARGDGARLRRLLLTASGGPFFGKTKEELQDVTAAEALSHPTWNMGRKVTVDSATMVNKGLEIIEAAHLFGMAEETIDVVVHRQSIVHSLVEFSDYSVLAQLGNPDMRLPIQYALTWPERDSSPVKPLSLPELGTLTFERPDEDLFPATRVAREALRRGGLFPCVFNAADEVAVAAFLRGELPFLEIVPLICAVLASMGDISGAYTFAEVFETDLLARERAAGILKNRRK